MAQDTNENIPQQLKHIQDFYFESFNFLVSWKKRKVAQLVLLNNLQRGDENIASTLLLTLFNRVVSSLYDDKLQVKFLPSQGIEQEQLNSYNTLAQSDYLEMGKPKLDYDWIWDALFFNRGYMETLRFNKKRKIMEPHVINPLVFGYDPYFPEVQEWRYYWKWVTKSKYELQRLIKNGTITGVTKVEEIPSGVDSELWNYKTLRDQAKKAIEPPTDSLGSEVYQILEFYTYDEDGEKCCYWVDKNFNKILYEEKLDLGDLEYPTYAQGKEDKNGSKWPIVVKEAFREPHASINFGIADLLEDKHRAKSVLLNLAYIAAKDKANPLYWYNDNVSDVTSFFSRQIDQHIKLEAGATGDTSVGPINTQEPMSPELIQFISLLQQEANEPLGTGVALPQDKTEQTATGKAIDQQLNDMAQSLQSKIMQFGESEFWSHWFHRYAKYGPELKEKMANIVGVKGITSEMIDMKDFNTDFPPGVLVYSAKEAEYKELVLRRDLMQLYPELAQTLDPDGLRNFNKYVFFPKFLQDPSLIDIMLPKTIDEIKAEDENQQLMDDSMPEVLPTDNHTTHIYVHNMIPPGKRTWSMWFHIAGHEQALAQQKAMEMQAQQLALQQAQMKGAGQPQSGPGKMQAGSSPQQAAVPLKSAQQPSNNLISNNQQ